MAGRSTLGSLLTSRVLDPAFGARRAPVGRVENSRPLLVPFVDAGLVLGAGKQIVALRAYTGQLLWNYTTGGAVAGSAAMLSDDASSVVVGSDDGFLYALDTKSGRLLWRQPASAARDPNLWPVTAPVVSQGSIYTAVVSTDHNTTGPFLSRMDAATGAAGWGVGQTSVHGGAALLSGGLVAAYDDAGYVQAVRAETGDSVWKVCACAVACCACQMHGQIETPSEASSAGLVELKRAWVHEDE